MMRTLRSIMLLGLMLVGASCASTGRPYADLANGLPPVGSDRARIVYFNPKGVGLAKSLFQIDGNRRSIPQLGGSRDGTFSYVDVRHGDHIIGVYDGWYGQFARRVRLVEGQTVHVLVGLGRLSVVPETEARRILGPCRFKSAKTHEIEVGGPPEDALPFDDDPIALGTHDLPEDLGSPPAGRARVVWYKPLPRTSWLSFLLLTEEIVVDEVRRGGIRPGQYGFADFTPGQHRMSTLMPADTVIENSGGHNPRDINVEEGKLLFIEVTNDAGSALIEVTSETAAVELRTMRPKTSKDQPDDEAVTQTGGSGL